MTDKKKPRLNFEVQEGLELEPDIDYSINPREHTLTEPEPEYVALPLSNPYWEVREWKMGLLKVYRCRQCSLDMGTEDEIMLHILNHYPVEEQEGRLTKLLALKGKE